MPAPTLDRFAGGDTNYIGKHNNNATAIEVALARFSEFRAMEREVDTLQDAQLAAAVVEGLLQSGALDNCVGFAVTHSAEHPPDRGATRSTPDTGSR